MIDQRLIIQYNQNLANIRGELCGRCAEYFPDRMGFLLHLTKRYSLIQKREIWGCPSSPILPADYTKNDEIYARKVELYY